jgi:hypothetical protein
MSFSDLMSSGRGPGVIGMVMALIVLLGFGLLFMVATDEGFQGGDQSIESLIAHQAKDIEFSKGALERGVKSLGDAPERIKWTKELNSLQRGTPVFKERIVALGGNIQSRKAEAVRGERAFEDYKNQYRAHVRSKAKGESMDTLQTQGGVVYKNVNIRGVTAVGIQIRHDDGHKRIPFEDLPAAMQDYYQFDPKQKAEAVTQEQVAWNEHEAAVSVANLASDRQVAEQAAKDAEAIREKTLRSIALKESRTESLSNEIESLEAAITKEIEKSISNAPQMRAQLANKQSALAALLADIARMRADLSK